MGPRVILLCLVFARISTQEDKYYKTDIKPGDQKSSTSEHIGFTQPLDFSSFSQQFFNEGNDPFHQEPLSQSGNFDIFGAESKNRPNLPNVFPKPSFQEQSNSGFVESVSFPSAFARDNGVGSIKNAPELKYPQPKGTPKENLRAPVKSEQQRGKSNYPSPYAGFKSDHAPKYRANQPPSAVYANSEDIEIFYPPGKTILPRLNGRPRPYDGYRSVADAMGEKDEVDEGLHMYKPAKRHYPLVQRHPYGDRRPQKFFNAEASESRNEEREADDRSDEDEHLEEESGDESDKSSSGYRYQFDEEIVVPDLVIKTYPYERQIYDDSEFTKDYEKYTQSLDTDLEKRFGVPDFKFEQYTEEVNGDLAEDSNCRKVEGEDGTNTCYVCKNPQTGANYEQCSYEKEPTNKKYSYKSQNYSKKKPNPMKYRYKRSSDIKPSEFKYLVQGESVTKGTQFRPNETTEKRKHKKFNPLNLKKQNRRKPRQNEESEGPPSSYNGPEFTYEGPSTPYEGPRYSYEGPSSSYEGPRHSYDGPNSPYEGPSQDYEGPDHDEYYDSSDDRLPNDESDSPASYSDEDVRSRYKQGPKDDVEEFKPTKDSTGRHNYRFGPEFFDDDGAKEEKTKNKPRQKIEKVFIEEVDKDPKSGMVKIFKNGDVCEKVKRKNLICMVCNNDGTGAKYEQCQYSKKPTSQGYTYGTEKSYSSKKPKNPRPERHTDQEPQISESKYVYTKVERQVFGDDEGDDASYIRKQRNVPTDEEGKDVLEERSDSAFNSRPYDFIDRAGIENVDKHVGKAPGGASYQLLGETHGTSNNKLFPQTNETFEEYFSRVFPQFEVFGKLSSSVLGPVADLDTLSALPGLDAQAKRGAKSASAPTEEKEDLKMLAQTLEMFHTKDWSNCTKRDFGKMVCYECPTPEGIINEECMFVDQSKPTATPSGDESTAANILTAVQSAILSGHMDDAGKFHAEPSGKFKGDYEGTGSSLEEQQSGDRKIKKKKKTSWRDRQDTEPTVLEDVWESGKQPSENVDMASVKIFFNSTST